MNSALMLLNHLPPELTYTISHAYLAVQPAVWLTKLYSMGVKIPHRVGGRVLDSPIGLAAGIDKDGLLIRLAASMPMGFHTVGSVTLNPRRGNPRPRFVKYVNHNAMVNAMGLPSRGALAVSEIVRRNCPRWPRSKMLIVSVAGFSIAEILATAMLFDSISCVDAVEINVSSPTYRGQWLGGGFTDLLRTLSRLGKQVLVKIPLSIDTGLVTTMIRRVIEHGYGLTVANTLTIKSNLPVGYGGLSGAPINPLVIRLVKAARRMGHRGLLIAAGGFMDTEDVLRGIRAGADLVGMATAFAFKGPIAIVDAARGLLYLGKRLYKTR